MAFSHSNLNPLWKNLQCFEQSEADTVLQFTKITLYRYFQNSDIYEMINKELIFERNRLGLNQSSALEEAKYLAPEVAILTLSK